MPDTVMPMSSFMSAEAAQSALHLGGRFLLMVSMTLFLSYVLFVISTVVVSSLLSTARSVRGRLAHKLPGASGAPPSVTPTWQADSTADRHGARA